MTQTVEKERHTDVNNTLMYMIILSIDHSNQSEIFKGALSGLRQLLATESSLKMIKNAFYFTLKALFILKIFQFLS